VNEIKITLIGGGTYESDEIGNRKLSPKEKAVFAKVVSASSAEFWRAGQTGLGADYKAEVWSFEYNGEVQVRFNNALYDVYRTYVRGDKTELYLRKAIGAQNEVN
jgi:hypothetical protein